jgi:HD-GYP domain-containing protein (c-di-GMP phosphodiesterase class II)
MSEHKDILEALNKDIPLKAKLVHAHRVIQQYFPYIARIAITIYDPETTELSTYLHTGDDDVSSEHYSELLGNAPSLENLIKSGQPRVITNMVTSEEGVPEHIQRVGRHGYATSYTMPMFNRGMLVGFIFFNSHDSDAFHSEDLNQLDIFGHMIALMVINELAAVKTLTAALKTTGHITHIRDPETGSHLDRMSRYARLIAAALARDKGLDNEFIEHVFLFSPLHDIGKIAIPDEILLKKDKLTNEEYLVMRGHAIKGREIVDDLLKNFGLEAIEHVELLRNIASYHHEAINGGGYPEGRVGDEIPLEARIVAVADVFDALTSRRPYKDAWDNDKAFEWLSAVAGEQLDSDCVDALMRHREDIEKIQGLFKEDMFG